MILTPERARMFLNSRLHRRALRVVWVAVAALWIGGHFIKALAPRVFEAIPIVLLLQALLLACVHSRAGEGAFAGGLAGLVLGFAIMLLWMELAWDGLAGSQRIALGAACLGVPLACLAAGLLLGSRSPRREETETGSQPLQS